MAHNDVEILWNASFTRYRFLTELNFCYNNIKMIESATFDTVQNLNELRLCNNREISLLNFTSFILRNLSYLDVSYCNLATFPSDVLDILPRLKSLRLSGNYLETFTIKTCTPGQLHTIFLNDNQFQILTPNTFSLACNSDYLNLGENPIFVVDPNAIAFLSVRRLYLHKMTFSLKQWSNVITGLAWSDIQEIKLTFWYLGNIPDGFFSPLHDHFLQKLYLNNNKINYISEQTFQSLNRVRELIMYYNKIEVIEPRFFSNMTELRVLNLNNNPHIIYQHC